MNFILENSNKMPFFVDLRVVFKAFSNLQINYNWLISDLECNVYPQELQCAREDLLWVDGKSLTELVTLYDIQFIWGVFSGFNPELKIDLNDDSNIPFADGNPEFWKRNPKIQHPQASVEIICFDSTLLLLFTKDIEIANNFKSFFPEAQSLEEHNAR